MNTKQFINHVKKMAEDNDIHFYMMADGITAYRGTIQEITAGSNGHTAGMVDRREVNSKYTYYDIFKMINSIPQQNPPIPHFVNSSDLPNYPDELGEYHMRIATHQSEFMIWTGTIDEPGVPIVTIIMTPSDEVLISYMETITEKNEDGIYEEKIGSLYTDRISNLASIGRSLRHGRLPSHIAYEVETFMVEILNEMNS